MKFCSSLLCAVCIWCFTLAMAQAQLGFGSFDLGNVDPIKLIEGTGKAAKGLTGIGLQEELSIGGSVALEIVNRYGVIWRDAQATKRVNLIGKTLAQYCNRPNLPYRFGILNSDEINAFSAPGGYVFITRGTYQAAENDNQLAGVLAHEIAHIVKRHALRIISRNETLSGLTDVASGASSDFANFDVGIDKITGTLLKSGYDSNSEYEADRSGKELAKVTGFSADGLQEFLEKLQSKNSGSTFHTHPALQSRIERLSGAEPTPSTSSSRPSSRNPSYNSRR